MNSIDKIVDKIVCSDSLKFTKSLPDKCVDMICTSPPFWQQRDYDVDEQYGMEEKLGEYIDVMYSIFSECKRVLKPKGSSWVNIGDCYNENTGGFFDNENNDAPRIGRHTIKTRKYQPEFPRRSLLLIPYRFAIKMIDDGKWLCRNMIIWKKRNVRPTTAHNRFTIDFEPMFLFTKTQQYYFNLDAAKWIIDDGDMFYNPSKRERRTVWDIDSENKGTTGHGAPYPVDLARVPIMAGCPKGGVVFDPFIGSGTTAVAARELGCHFVGCDINEEYCEKAKKRVEGTS